MSPVVSGLLERLASAPPKAGRTRVIAIDGRSGAGKSTLARQLRNGLCAPLITMEDLYEGWHGLARGIECWSRKCSHHYADIPCGRPRAGANAFYDEKIRGSAQSVPSSRCWPSHIVECARVFRARGSSNFRDHNSIPRARPCIPHKGLP